MDSHCVSYRMPNYQCRCCFTTHQVIELMLQGARDAIPNVRFTAARALQEMAPYIDETALQGQVLIQMTY
jgi:hypothetical protein